MLQPGAVVAKRFQIERAAQKGGMGFVYRGVDTKTGEAIALKVLGDKQESRERFAREAKFLSLLKHPHIVRYILHGLTETGQPYLAMEWLEGEDLSTRLSRTRMDVQETIALVTYIAKALSIIHSKGVIHRDIKPSNLFLVNCHIEQVKIIDFGVARLNGGSQGLTLSGFTVGTPAYMAPEQARGAQDIDTRVDIFSLGCVLFECLTGRSAFTGEHTISILAKILLQKTPQIRHLRDQAPKALDALVSRMLSKDPVERPKDGNALLKILQALKTTQVLQKTPNLETLPASLTPHEKTVVCIILIEGNWQIKTSETDQQQPFTNISHDHVKQLQKIAHQHQGNIELLPDGSIVVLIRGKEIAIDHASRAAKCALAIQKLFTKARMVVAMGQNETENLVLGDVFDRAVLMLRSPNISQSDLPNTKPPIFLDRICAELIARRFEIRFDQKSPTLVQEKPVRQFFEKPSTFLGGTTTCVGREDELSFCEKIFLESINTPVAKVLLLTGDVGVGKSRLGQEFLQKISQHPVDIMFSRGDLARINSPFALLIPILYSIANISPTETILGKQKKLTRFFQQNLSENQQNNLSSFLEDILQISPSNEFTPSKQSLHEESLLQNEAILSALTHWIQQRNKPVLLLLEDLQWSDLPSIHTIDILLKNLHQNPFFVFAFARPEEHESFPALWAAHAVEEISLAKLSSQSCSKLVYEVLGKGLPQEIVDEIVTLSIGNPFYLEELIRAHNTGQKKIPDTVLILLQTKLQTLPNEAKQLLRAASIFGQHFWKDALKTLLGFSLSSVEHWLWDLTEKGLLQQSPSSRFPEQIEYQFCQKTIQAASYATLTTHDQKLGHYLVGNCLEKAGETDPILLAKHFELGEVPERAIGCYLLAAQKALHENNFQQTLLYVERGVQLGAQKKELGLFFCIKAEALRWLSQYPEAEWYGVEAIRILEPDTKPWYQAIAHTASTSGILGNYERLLALCGELLVQTGADVSSAKINAWANVALQGLFAGRYDMTRSLVKRLKNFEEKAKHSSETVRSIYQARGFRALYQGDLFSHLELMEGVIASFEQGGNIRDATQTRAELGFAYIEIGAYHEAKSTLHEALTCANKLGLQETAALAKRYLGLLCAYQNNLDEAEKFEKEAAKSFRAQGNRRMEGGALVYLSIIQRLLMQLEASENSVKTAITLLQAVPPLQAYALSTLAHLYLSQGKTKAAHQEAKQAFKILEKLGQVPEGESSIRLMYAETLEAIGQPKAAVFSISQAKKRLITRAEKINDLEWQESFLSRVPENARTLAIARTWKQKQNSQTPV